MAANNTRDDFVKGRNSVDRDIPLEPMYVFRQACDKPSLTMVA